jgi:hypothetical protein
MPGPDPNTLKPKVLTLQRNTAALMSLLGGDDDDQLRFWEILKGVTTPAIFRLVEHELDTMQNAVDQVQNSVTVLEYAAKEMR